MPRVLRPALRLSALLAAVLATADCSYLFPSCATIPGCPKGQVLCNNLTCSDLLSDPFHCGMCNHPCAPGLVCVPLDGPETALDGGVGAGDVADPDGGATCACPIPGQILAHGQCFDLRVDPDNCGAIDNACRADQACLDGGCGCVLPPLLAEMLDGGSGECATDAGPVCADLLNDPQNCGTCGHACAGGECTLAICEPGAPDAGDLADGGDGGAQGDGGVSPADAGDADAGDGG
jgi:hypothetical protein